MLTIGKKYLIQSDQIKQQKTKEGIILPTFGNQRNYLSYFATIISYGTGFSEQQKKDLIPIGTRVIIDYNSNDKTKLLMNDKTYFLIQEKDILAIISDGE